MKYDQTHMCHLLSFVYQIPHSKPNRENVYVTELHNAISNQDGDLRNAINRRNISGYRRCVYNTEWT
jgi:hypothetical protein